MPLHTVKSTHTASLGHALRASTRPQRIRELVEAIHLIDSADRVKAPGVVVSMTGSGVRHL